MIERRHAWVVPTPLSTEKESDFHLVLKEDRSDRPSCYSPHFVVHILEKLRLALAVHILHQQLYLVGLRGRRILMYLFQPFSKISMDPL
jgi:hypothetical protein